MLSQSPALDRLAELQSSLDAVDIEGLALRFGQSNDGLQLDAAHADALDPEVSLGEYVRIASALRSSGSLGPWTDVRTLQAAYLLSAAFKDCSIFVQLYEDGTHDVRFVDVDAKPIARLPRYAGLDGEIWRNAAVAPLGALPDCVDPRQ